MARPSFKFQMYKRLQVNTPKIYAEAKKAAETLKMPADVIEKLRAARSKRSAWMR